VLALLPLGLVPAVCWFVGHLDHLDGAEAVLGFATWALVSGGALVARGIRLRRALAALNESQALLNGGNDAGAAAVCERLLANAGWLGAVPATALNNLSIAVFHRGEAARALAMLDEIERAGWARARLRPYVLINRALYLTALGDVERAEETQRRARVLLTAASADTSLFYSEVLLGARAGRWADVLAWTGTSSARRRMSIKAVRILRAWALVATGAPAAEEVRSLLEGVRPAEPGELHHLAVHWPALREFLQAHGLSDVG
jgi:hypothetical protein